MATTPPTVPPTIAPILVLVLGLGSVESSWIGGGCCFAEDEVDDDDVKLDEIGGEERVVAVREMLLKAEFRGTADPLMTKSPNSISQHASVSVPLPQQ